MGNLIHLDKYVKWKGGDYFLSIRGITQEEYNLIKELVIRELGWLSIKVKINKTWWRKWLYPRAWEKPPIMGVFTDKGQLISLMISFKFLFREVNTTPKEQELLDRIKSLIYFPPSP